MGEDHIRLPFLAGVKYKGKIYFSAMRTNGLFSYDTVTGETHFIKPFDQEKMHFYLHSKAFLYKNEMWLVPMGADNVACVNLDTTDIRYFPIPGRETFPDAWAFLDGVIDQGYLYITPYDCTLFLKVDLEAHTLSKLYQAEERMMDWSRGCFVRDGKLHTVTSDGRIGLKIDTQTGECEKLYDRTGSSDAYLYSLCADGQLWMIPYRSDTFKIYDIASATETSFPIPNPSESYFRGIDTGEYIIAFPATTSRQFLFINKQAGEVGTTPDCFTGEDEPTENWFELNVIESDDGYWATSINGVIFEFSAGAEIHIYHADMSHDEYKKATSNAFEDSGVYARVLAAGPMQETKYTMEMDTFLQHLVKANS